LRKFPSWNGNDFRKRNDNGSSPPDRLCGKNLSAFQRYRHAGFRSQRETTHFHRGGGEIVAGAVLGQVGQHQRLGTGWAGPLLAALARRADLQCGHPGASPCAARRQRVAARASRRLRAPETEQSLAGYLRPGSRRSEEHTSELQSRLHLVCRLLLEKKKKQTSTSFASKTDIVMTDGSSRVA